MKNDEFYRVYATFDKIIIRHEQKLLQARKKDFNKDFSEQQEVIDTLIYLRGCIHRLYDENLKLKNGQIEVVIEREKLLNRILRLEAENKTLKQNIEI
jgi:hypothetical protein